MTKDEIVSNIIDARSAHEKWVEYGRMLVQGADIKTVQPYLACTACKFGRWFYKEQGHIKNIPGFKTIETLHEEFHDMYKALYKMAPDVQKPRGLFTSKNDYEFRQDQFKRQFTRLEKKSRELTKKLEMVEGIVTAMSDKLFDRNQKKGTEAV